MRRDQRIEADLMRTLAETIGLSAMGAASLGIRVEPRTNRPSQFQKPSTGKVAVFKRNLRP